MADVSLSLVVLKTRQVEQVRLFYQILGVELAEERHGTGPIHFAGRVGDAVIEIYPLADDGTPADSSTRLGFAVVELASVVQTNPLGVMHKAIIVTPGEAERRIVNSTMLVTEGGEISVEKQQEFVTTNKISQKNY